MASSSLLQSAKASKARLDKTDIATERAVSVGVIERWMAAPGSGLVFVQDCDRDGRKICKVVSLDVAFLKIMARRGQATPVASMILQIVFWL